MAYVQLRFRATFGAAADSWRVVHAEPVPGRALPACAIDEALRRPGLLEALQRERLQALKAYKASAQPA